MSVDTPYAIPHQSVASTGSSVNIEFNAMFAKLPHVVIAKVFSHLSWSDRLRASSTCKAWRVVLFTYAPLWRHFKLTFRLTGSSTDELLDSTRRHFLTRYARQIAIFYDTLNAHTLEQLRDALVNVRGDMIASRCSFLTHLSLRTLGAVNKLFCPTENEQQIRANNNELLCEQTFAALCRLISESKSLEHFSLDADFLWQQRNNGGGQNIAHLLGYLSQQLKSLYMWRSHAFVDTMPMLGSLVLSSFKYLSQLGLDYADIDDEFLSATRSLVSLSKSISIFFFLF